MPIRGLGLSASAGATGPQGATGAAGATGATGPAGPASMVSQTIATVGYTLALADQDKFSYATGGSMLLNVTTAAVLAYPTDSEYNFCQFAGVISVTYAAGVTIISANGYKSATLGAVFTIKNKSTNLWIMFGNTIP